MNDDLRGALRGLLDGSPMAIVDRGLHAILAGIPPTRSAAAQQIAARRGQVAVIPVWGIIDSRTTRAIQYFGGTPLDLFTRAFRHAMYEPEISAVVLHCDSPGGSAYGVEEASKVIHSARGGKRIVAVVDCLCASAAYWLAASADEVVVTPSGEAGSIGVFTVHVDWSEALAKEGVKPTIIRSGANKAEGNPYERLSAGALAHLQSLVDAFGGMFEKAVARGRGVPVATVCEKFGQGRTFDSARLVQLGMADRVATLDEVVEDLARGKSRPASRSASSPAVTPAGGGPSNTPGNLPPVSEKVDADAAVPWAVARRFADAEEWQRTRRVAWHEAGHCVAAFVDGAGIKDVGINFKVEGGRFSHAGGFVTLEHPERATPFVYAAGMAAQIEAGLVLSGINTDGDVRELERLGCNDVNAAIREATLRLRSDWNAVYAIANGLLAHGSLTGADASLRILAELPDWRREMLGWPARTAP